jgi:hypothetical protein
VGNPKLQIHIVAALNILWHISASSWDVYRALAQ